MFRLAVFMSGAVLGTYLVVSYIVSPVMEFTNQLLTKMDAEHEVKEQQLRILSGGDPSVVINPSAAGPKEKVSPPSNCNTGFVKTDKFNEIKGETVMRFNYQEKEHAFVLLDHETLYFNRTGDSCFSQKSYDRELHQIGMKILYSCGDQDTEINCLE